jgi:hypothetical protein
LYKTLASILVIGGGLFWTLVVFVGVLSFPGSNVLRSMASGLVWVAVAALVLVVGLYWDYIAAALLGVALFASVVYGAANMGFEPGVWGIWAVFLMLPIVISAALYLLAGRERAICDKAAAGAPAS